MTFNFKIFKFLWAGLIPEHLHESNFEAVQSEQKVEPIVAESLPPVDLARDLTSQIFLEYLPCHIVYHVERIVWVAQATIDGLKVIISLQDE